MFALYGITHFTCSNRFPKAPTSILNIDYSRTGGDITLSTNQI